MADNNLILRNLSQSICYVTGCRLHEGEKYGLELELEGRGVKLEEIPTKGWLRHEDGSLRGEAIEFVSSAPVTKEEAQKRVNTLFELFKKHDVKLKNSYRCSTHVHINFSDRKLGEVVNFFILFTVLEELLNYHCGPDRSGNLFCLSNREVEGVVKNLQEAVLRGNFGAFGEELRYCGINLSALNKFGTIEIRTMRGADSAVQITDWLEILSQMYSFAVNKMESPVALIESLSKLGPLNFLSEIFNEKTINLLLKSWDGDLQRSFYDGARLVQIMSYRFDDGYKKYKDKNINRFEKVEVKNNEKALRWVLYRDRVVQVPIPKRHGELYHIDNQEERQIFVYNQDVSCWICNRKVLTWCSPAGAIIPSLRIVDRGRIIIVPGYPFNRQNAPHHPHIIWREEDGRWYNEDLQTFCGFTLEEEEENEDED